MSKKEEKSTNHFRENRQNIQKALFESGFVKIIQKTHLPLCIEESKTESGKLQRLWIDNIPASDLIRPQAWLINMELDKSPFSSPPHFKTVEKAIMFFTCESLYILMIEMKTTLKPDKQGGTIMIREKFEDSATRIALLLTTYVFGSIYNNIRIKYFGIICYNKETWTKEALQDPDFAKDDLYKQFKGSNSNFFLMDKFKEEHKVNIFFSQNNSSNPEEMQLDLAALFTNDYEFENAQHTELTFPRLELLPKSNNQ